MYFSIKDKVFTSTVEAYSDEVSLQHTIAVNSF